MVEPCLVPKRYRLCDVLELGVIRWIDVEAKKVSFLQSV